MREKGLARERAESESTRSQGMKERNGAKCEGGERNNYAPMNKRKAGRAERSEKQEIHAEGTN